MRDERCEEALAVTQAGSDLLEHSRWFSLLLLDELLGFGIPIDRITLEHQVGGDEMDCLADISGELIFFELKDKEFSLGNAYSFGSKMSVLQPNHSVIVTTESVAADAKDHFQRAQAAQRGSRRVYFDEDDDVPTATPIRYIEGLDRLRTALADLVTNIYTRDAINLLTAAASFGAASPVFLLRAVRERAASNAVRSASNGAPKAKASV
jgi:hypothetical protein